MRAKMDMSQPPAPSLMGIGYFSDNGWMFTLFQHPKGWSVEAYLPQQKFTLRDGSEAAQTQGEAEALAIVMRDTWLAGMEAMS